MEAHGTIKTVIIKKDEIVIIIASQLLMTGIKLNGVSLVQKRGIGKPRLF